MSGQREHVFTARHNSCVLYPFWGKIIIGKVHCNVRIVLFIEMSEDLSNTDHSTWELRFGSSLSTCCPAARCSMFALHTAPTLSGKASPAPPLFLLRGDSLVTGNAPGERTALGGRCGWHVCEQEVVLLAEFCCTAVPFCSPAGCFACTAVTALGSLQTCLCWGMPLFQFYLCIIRCSLFFPISFPQNMAVAMELDLVAVPPRFSLFCSLPHITFGSLSGAEMG